MKKIFLAAAVLTAFILAAVNAYAYSDDDFSDVKTFSAENAYTIITDTENIKHRLDGVIDADELEESDTVSKIASYTVFADGREVINVELTDIVSQGEMSAFAEGTAMTNGYYSVKFTLNEEEHTECFLTGLSDTNLGEVQTKLVGAVLENSQFTMDSLDFIDTEKTGITSYGDSGLCWAATPSNMLHYSGWGAKAGEENLDTDFNSEDDIFDLFSSAFTNSGGYEIYGIQWFFNGVYKIQNNTDDPAKVKNYGESGGYLKKYAYGSVAKEIEIAKDHKKMSEAFEALENGCAVGLGIDFLGYNSGHALTLWGYIYDTDYDETDLEYLTEVIISDSDSDEQSDQNRRLAPNKLRVINLSPYTEGIYDSWEMNGYESATTLLTELTVLKPYSDDLAYETDEDATLDLFNTCDFSVSDTTVSLDKDFPSEAATAAAGDNIYIQASVDNDSDVKYEGSLKYTVTITGADGNIAAEKEFEEKITAASYGDCSLTAEMQGLSAGNYTVTVKLNPDKEIEEAYYYNNTYSTELSVLEKTVDTSAMSVSMVSIGEFSQGKANAELSYRGLDEVSEQYQSPVYTLYASYFENGEWSGFTEVTTSEGGPVGSLLQSYASAPSECTVEFSGEKVKFKLLIKESDNIENPENPPIMISSDEYDLKYAKLSLEESAENTGKYTSLDKGAKELADGEVFAFSVKNTSTDDTASALPGTVKVYATAADDDDDGDDNDDDSEKILLCTQDINVEYGESEEISFSSWDAELSGTYTVSAELEFDGAFGYLELGTIKVKETPTLSVTSTDDTVDEYDGIVTLREAIAYANSGDEITIDFGTNWAYITLTEPLVIDKEITITGRKDKTYILYGAESVRIISVTETGNVSLNDISLNSGYSLDNGGGIEVDGGKAVLTDCYITSCTGGSAGGAVYAGNGGSVTLKNCTVRNSTAGYGGAVCVSGGARLDMLCCDVFGNSSNGGAIYNNGSEAYIIYSTLFENSVKYSGGAAVTSEGDKAKTAMVGCISAGNLSSSSVGVGIGGNVRLYGTYYTSAGEDVIKDAYSVCGESKKIFACSLSGSVKYDHPEKTSVFDIYTSPIARTGIYIKNDDDGKLSYSPDGSTWISTDIVSAFTDEEYTLDKNGTEHDGMFGASWSVKNETLFADANESSVAVYSPEKTTAVLIVKTQNDDGSIASVSVKNIELDIGTSTIETPTDGAAIYMLWNSLEGMTPLCKSIEY